MKHLQPMDKMHKNFYRDFNFCKEELDKLSYQEITYDLRIDLIQKSRPDYKRKCDELEIYVNIRFKEKELDMYAEWLRKSKITDKVLKKDGYYQDFYVDKEKNDDKFTETEMGTFKLLSKVVDSMGGPEKYYNTILKSNIDKLGKSVYGLY